MHPLRTPLLLILTLAASTVVAAPAVAFDAYQAKLRRTSFGIPHILAHDWGSLGYGYGFAFAEDNFCTLMRDVVVANGELSRHFGPDGRDYESDFGTGTNLTSDFFYAWANPDDLVREAFDSQRRAIRELVIGYAAGFNRYLRETGAENLPEACRDAAWVREIDEIDLFKVFHKLLLFGSSGFWLQEIVDAEPPAPAVAPAGNGTALGKLSTLTDPALGSNAVALGRDATRSGRGMLLGNPHFPWVGPERFYQVHLTIPGRIDVMGASLYGVPLVLIGFNRHVAWSHTVSTAARFTMFELTLVPGDPMAYVYDGQERRIEAHPVRVEVLEADGSIGTRDHVFYSSHFGPMLAFTPIGVWNEGGALSLRDANFENFRGLEQWFRMDRAKSMDEFVDSLGEVLGIPWVNTIAASHDGLAFYGDVSAVPGVPQAKLDDCVRTGRAALLTSFGAPTLDGSDSACEWDVDPSTPQPGLLPPDQLPMLIRTDYVTNSNDSHWLANPEQPLEGYSAVIGDERTERSLRTRAGLVQVQERLAGTDGLPGRGFTLRHLQEMLFSNRNYGAELVLDDVLGLCFTEPNEIDVGGGEIVDVGEACAVLEAWDRRHDVESVGAFLFRRYFSLLNDPANYLTDFDPDDPVATPAGLRLENANHGNRTLQALARTVAGIEDAGLPLDAAWGDVHFEDRSGEAIPIHGGPGFLGVFNVMSAGGFDAGVGYHPMVAGGSYIQAVTFGRKGPRARAILTYSQSTNPESPHFADQTHLYSREEWVRLPFREVEIRRDPEVQRRFLFEHRNPSGIPWWLVLLRWLLGLF